VRPGSSSREPTSYQRLTAPSQHTSPARFDLTGVAPRPRASSVRPVLIAEELLLLCLDPGSGRSKVGNDRLDPALAGALLAELALLERVGVTEEGTGWSAWTQRRRVKITDLRPTDDPELDQALQVLAEGEGKPVKDFVTSFSRRRLSKGLRQRLLERLAATGVLDRRAGTVLGFIPSTTWPERDRRPEDEVRQRLHAALVAGVTPTERTVTLVALLQVTGALTKILDVEDRKAVKARAKELSEGDWAAKAVKQAIEEAAAAGASAAAAGAAGGGS
jgi:hypothetical protein